MLAQRKDRAHPASCLGMGQGGDGSRHDNKNDKDDLSLEGAVTRMMTTHTPLHKTDASLQPGAA